MKVIELQSLIIDRYVCEVLGGAVRVLCWDNSHIDRYVAGLNHFFFYI